MNAGGRSGGSSVSSTSSSASPSSPTRRLKKGGKRRRRLCHKEGCTLCPSFGYEGHVAVTCSRHKEEGMRNLTARRCQHMGCFTAANFGIPGDKPRFCLAHSTEGMVNRNKPHGRNGMLIAVACDSRRTAKATDSVNDGNSANNKESRVLGAAAAADAQALKGSAMVGNCPVSGGKGILMRAVRARSGDVGVNGGDRYGPLSPRTSTNARPRGSGRSAVTVGDAVTSVEYSRPMPSMALTNRGDMTVWIPKPLWESESGFGTSCSTASAAFVSRGDVPDGLSAGRSSHKVKKDLGSANVLQAPSHRVETEDFEKHPPSNGRGVLGGVPERRGVVNAPLDLGFAGDFGNSGDIMNGGGPSFVMDGANCLNSCRRMDSDRGFQIGATLEDILGVRRDDIKTDVFDSKGSQEQEPFWGRCNSSSAIPNSGLRLFANDRAVPSSAGLGLDGLLPTVDSVVGVEEVRSGSKCDVNEVRGINFEIDHLSERNSVFLSGLHNEKSSQDIRQQQQQGHYLCSGASNSRNGSGLITIGSGLWNVSYASLTPSSSSKMATDIANESLVDAAIRSTPRPATPTQTPATPRGTPTAPGTPEAPDGRKASWHHLEEKDVAIPGPVWGPKADEEELASAGDVIGDSICHDHDNLGGGDASRRAGEGNGVPPGASTDVGFSLIPRRVGGSGGVSDGGACLSPPPKKRHFGDNNQHASLPTHLGSTPLGNRSMKHGDISLVASGLSRSGGGSSMTMATPPTPASQINMGGDFGVAGGMPRASSGVMRVSQQRDGGSMGLGSRRMI